mmetsp:Transcript_7592/g.12782  ORF Transcript_7592/g.12782 Transcript_7592/m.12782 type:complete len:261 (-) Transcript_7592:76-858(-)
MLHQGFPRGSDRGGSGARAARYLWFGFRLWSLLLENIHLARVWLRDSGKSAEYFNLVTKSAVVTLHTGQKLLPLSPIFCRWRALVKVHRTAITISGIWGSHHYSSWIKLIDCHRGAKFVIGAIRQVAGLQACCLRPGGVRELLEDVGRTNSSRVHSTCTVVYSRSHDNIRGFHALSSFNGIPQPRGISAAIRVLSVQSGRQGVTVDLSRVDGGVAVGSLVHLDCGHAGGYSGWRGVLAVCRDCYCLNVSKYSESSIIKIS